MTYYLYIDGGGNSVVDTYFSYLLYENNKIAGPIIKGPDKEFIQMNRYLLKNIPLDELPPNCSIYDDKHTSTNNIAEIAAFYYAIKHVKDVSGLMPLVCRQDSKLIVNLVNGQWICHKYWLKPWLSAIHSIRWPECQVEWVPRDKIFSILGH